MDCYVLTELLMSQFLKLWRMLGQIVLDANHIRDWFTPFARAPIKLSSVGLVIED
jgi:hypothetical protein